MEENVSKILSEMSDYLDIFQMQKLQQVLIKNLSENQRKDLKISNDEYLIMFINAKTIEDCSPIIVDYYKTIVE